MTDIEEITVRVKCVDEMKFLTVPVKDLEPIKFAHHGEWENISQKNAKSNFFFRSFSCIQGRSEKWRLCQIF